MDLFSLVVGLLIGFVVGAGFILWGTYQLFWYPTQVDRGEEQG